MFERAREKDPHRIEHLDAYSNILYVREKRAELSYLAHRYGLSGRLWGRGGYLCVVHMDFEEGLVAIVN